MKTTPLALILAAAFAVASGASAATKDYQVTGPVLEVSDTMVAVKKGNDRWEIARDANTKADREVKVGDKVTVYYTMTATKIEGKGGADAKGKAKASPSPSGEKK